MLRKEVWRRIFWRGVGRGLSPMVGLWLLRRARQGREDSSRLHERWGVSHLTRPPGQLIWAHGASVGEVTALLPLLRRLQEKQPGLHVLLTSGTVTSATIVARQDWPGLIHQYVPLDLPVAIDRFLAHWQPDLVLWSESDLWPGILSGLRIRGIPSLLLQARMSERSARRWARFPSHIRWLLDCFTVIVPQTVADADRFRQLGAARIGDICNLKLAAPPLTADTAELDIWRATLGQRPRWLLASSHPGDEAIALRAHQALRAKFPDLLTIIVPRHPERGPVIAAELTAAGMKVSLRSEGAGLTPETDFYVADTLGELGLWYRLAPLVLMGGSLIPHGGQNPLEPARLGAAVLVGPHMFNFSEMVDTLLQQGAARRVGTEADLIAALGELLGDSDRLRAMGDAGRDQAGAQSMLLESLSDGILGRLPPAPAIAGGADP